jgi:HK97 family phage portal protein
MNESIAFGLAAYYAAIRCISEDCAKLPFPVYGRLTAGGKDRKPNHRVYELLNESVNDEVSSQSWRETSAQYALGWGDGISEIKRDRSGNAESMWPIHPTRISLLRNSTKQLFGRVIEDDGSTRSIPYRDLFHLHGLGNGVRGYSIARVARESLGGAIAKMKSGNALFGNASRPGGMVSYPVPLKDKAGWRAAWNASFQGADKSHQTAVVDSGATYTPIAVPHKDSQWIEARYFDIEEIARWFRMPPHKLQQLLRATFSNITEQNIEYVVDTLLPWLKRFEVEAKRKLLNSRADRSVFAEHLVDGLLRGAPRERNEAYQIQRRNGIINGDEWREKENMNPIKGGAGKTYIVEGNMTRLDQVGETPDDVIGNAPEPPGPPVEEVEEEERIGRGAIKLLIAEETRRIAREAEVTGGEDPGKRAALVDQAAEACRPVLLDGFRRVFRCQCDKIARAAKKPKFDEWTERFHDGDAEHVLEMLAPIIQSFERSAWLLVGDCELPQRIAERLGLYSKEFKQGYASRSKEKLEAEGVPFFTSDAMWKARAAVETGDVVEALAETMKRACGLSTEISDANSDA